MKFLVRLCLLFLYILSLAYLGPGALLFINSGKIHTRLNGFENIVKYSFDIRWLCIVMGCLAVGTGIFQFTFVWVNRRRADIIVISILSGLIISELVLVIIFLRGNLDRPIEEHLSEAWSFIEQNKTVLSSFKAMHKKFLCCAVNGSVDATLEILPLFPPGDLCKKKETSGCLSLVTSFMHNRQRDIETVFLALVLILAVSLLLLIVKTILNHEWSHQEHLNQGRRLTPISKTPIQRREHTNKEATV